MKKLLAFIFFAHSISGCGMNLYDNKKECTNVAGVEYEHEDLDKNDAVPRTTFHSHLKAFIEEVDTKALHSTEQRESAIILKEQDKITLTCQDKNIFAFQVTGAKEYTTKGSSSSELLKKRDELLKAAEEIKPPLHERAIFRFSLFLSQITTSRLYKKIFAE